MFMAENNEFLLTRGEGLCVNTEASLLKAKAATLMLLGLPDLVYIYPSVQTLKLRFT